MFIRSFAVLSLTTATLLSGCAGTENRTESDSARVEASTEEVYADSATMRVDGLGCPMCAESISLALKEVDAVGSSRVDLSEGVVYVDLNPLMPVTAAELRRAIDNGGFTFRSISFENRSK